MLFSIFFPFSLTLFLATPSLGVCSASLIIGVSRTEVSGASEVFSPSIFLNGPWGAQGGSPKFMMHTKEDKFFTQIAAFLFHIICHDANDKLNSFCPPSPSKFENLPSALFRKLKGLAVARESRAL